MKGNVIKEISDECLAVRLRMVNRAVSGLYDRALSRYGLTIAQMNLLVAVGRLESCPPGQIGQMLQLDPSTVSRNLEGMIMKGWLSAETGEGGRTKKVSLTPEGSQKISEASNAWRGAQSKAISMLGGGGVESIRTLATRQWKTMGIGPGK